MDPSPGSLGDRGLGWDWVESTFNKTDNLKSKANVPREARWVTLWPDLWFRAFVTHQESFSESWEARELVFQVPFLPFSPLQGASSSSCSPSFLHRLRLFLQRWHGWSNLVILLHEEKTHPTWVYHLFLWAGGWKGAVGEPFNPNSRIGQWMELCSQWGCVDGGHISVSSLPRGSNFRWVTELHSVEHRLVPRWVSRQLQFDWQKALPVDWHEGREHLFRRGKAEKSISWGSKLH